MNGTLVVGSNGLKTVGKPPYEVVFTLKLAEAVLALQPVGEWSVANILANLTPESLDSFKRLVKLDAALDARYKELCLSYPRVANLIPTSWPKIKYEDIAEETFVDCAPVVQLVFSIHGERFVTDKFDDYNALMTFEEFEKKYQRSVSDHMHAAGERKIRNLQRVIRLVDAIKPTTYSVSLVSGMSMLPTRELKVFSEEQIVMYAERVNATVLDRTIISSSSH